MMCHAAVATLTKSCRIRPPRPSGDAFVMPRAISTRRVHPKLPRLGMGACSPSREYDNAAIAGGRENRVGGAEIRHSWRRHGGGLCRQGAGSTGSRSRVVDHRLPRLIPPLRASATVQGTPGRARAGLRHSHQRRGVLSRARHRDDARYARGACRLRCAHTAPRPWWAARVREADHRHGLARPQSRCAGR